MTLPGVEPPHAGSRVGITDLAVRGFRTARDVFFSVGPLCALVGEADAGKSNLLAAIRAVLDPAAAPLSAADAATGSDGRVSIRATLADGREVVLEGAAGHDAVSMQDSGLPVVFLPAEARGGPVLAGRTGRGQEHEAMAIFRREASHRPPSSAAKASRSSMRWNPAARVASPA
jgi:predicted ATPase